MQGKLMEIAQSDYGTTDIPFLRRAANGKVSAAELRKVWNYRAAGLSAGDAREKLHRTFGNFPNNGRWRDCEDTENEQSISPRIAEHLRLKEIRRQEAEHLEAEKIRQTKKPVCLSRSDCDADLRGWPNHFSCRIPAGCGWLVFDRKEDVTWGKNRHWPTSKTVSYAASLFDGEWRKIRSVVFDRRGKWLRKLAAECGVHLAPHYLV